MSSRRTGWRRCPTSSRAWRALAIRGWPTSAADRASPPSPSADAFLDAHVDGFDLDAGSIADARARAADAGLDGRVRFLHADAGSLAAHGPYDLVLLLEALHDMADPVAALSAVRAALSPGGAVLVVDDQPSAALGTVMRSDTVHRLADRAGYTRVDVLPVDNEFFRLYRLDP